MKETMTWQCRIAPSLGDGFAGHPNDVWGTVPYTDPTKPCVFFGMYGLNDFQVLLSHQGERAILWAGSDIKNYVNDYWVDSDGMWKLKVSFPRDVIHFVENTIEQLALKSVGIDSMVIPSFLGDVSKYPIQELSKGQPEYYTTVSGNDFNLYGWYELESWVEKMPYAKIHLYGNTKEFKVSNPNIIHHGWVTQEFMDNQTKTMTGALRLTRFDGFSEILAKSILWGQKPLSPYIHYPFLNDREQFLSVVNKYPWNVKNN